MPTVAYAVESLLIAVILINSASLILWTAPSLESGYAFGFQVVEYCTVSVFLVEYALRFWTTPEGNPQ